jgi:hypothetical protein
MRALFVRLGGLALLLGLAVASAQASAEDWAGVPLDRLPALGLGAPTLDEQADRWRAPLPAGGWVELRWYPTAELAAADFERLVAFGASKPAIRVGPRQAGDAVSGLELKDNLIFRFSSPDGQGWDWVSRLGAQLVTQVPAEAWQTRGEGPGAKSWDLVGRRLGG